MRIDLVLMFGSRCREVVRYFLLVCFVCLTGGSVSGQAHSPLVTITGEVRDADGELLPGVAIVLKGTSLGCATDGSGKFKLGIPEQKEMILLFSFVGM